MVNNQFAWPNLEVKWYKIEKTAVFLKGYVLDIIKKWRSLKAWLCQYNESLNILILATS